MRIGDHQNDPPTTGGRDWGEIADTATLLWPQLVRILLVIDGRIRLNKASNKFGLGYVLDTLRAPFAWWVRFEVHVARRDELQDPDEVENPEPLTYPPKFRFTDAGFNLDAYDQVWFFGDLPNPDDGADGATTDADLPGDHGLWDSELKLLAEWMDRGGGVFATGDHNILGASMCYRIPRVRTMRRWTHEQGVPPKSASARHETLQPSNGDPETDALLQPLELVYRRAGTWPLLGHRMPHPLLDLANGVIDRFPDHMHEGEVIADGDVQLDQPLDIPEYNRPEYPFPTGVVASAPLGASAPFVRPRPHVIAYGQTTLGLSKRFGLVGVYDGDPIGLGRVVVDSTWHHWLSLNIHAIASAADPEVTFKAGLLGVPAPWTAYRKMQAYYRNVAIWLARPNQRGSMLVSGVWGVLTGSAPMEFSKADSARQIGERVLTTLGRMVSRGLLADLISPFMAQPAFAPPSVSEESSSTEPLWPGLYPDLGNQALVGGIGSALLPLASEHRDARSRRKRPRLDAESIRQRALEGVSRGNALISQSIHEAAAAMTAISANLQTLGTESPIDVHIPIEVRRLRVIAGILQLPDAQDPALIGGRLLSTIRLKLGDDVVAHTTVQRPELPSFEPHGAIMELNCAIGEVRAQAWESLYIEVLAGQWSSEPANPEAIRFADALHHDPSSWIGEHLPARSQTWRLWYRIENAGEC